MAANLGAYAEAKVRAYLEGLSAHRTNFCFERIFDAKSAGGRFQSQAGDFQAFYASGSTTTNWLLEVKSVEHDYRLPHKNFAVDQVARMRKRELAGSVCRVIFFSKTTKLWRVAPLSFFSDRSGGSWDMRPFPEGTLSESLAGTFPV